MILSRDSLATRIGAAVLASFALLAALVAIVLLWPAPPREGEGLFDLPVPAETAAIVEALEGCPPASRPLVLRALNTTTAAVSLEPGFPPTASDLRRAPELEWMFSRYSRLLAGRSFRVERGPGLPEDLLAWLGRGRAGPSVRLLVALRTGGVLIIEHRPSLLFRSYLARAAAIAAVAAIALLAGLSMAVRHAARPVEALARAARRFSFDQAAPDLPVAGPRELRELSAAFNDMQGRIRDLVEARTRALAAIAHDLRTYLTRLRLRADFITDHHQRLRAIGDIEEMSLLLEDTLTFARPGAASHLGESICDAEVEIGAFVAQARELGWPVRLIANGRSSSAMVACERLSLRRMLHNLTDNAVRYAGQAEIRLQRSCGAWQIEVADAGPGVPPADLARIVQPFERLETSRGRETGGAGLGLAIVRSLAEQAGGSLTLANAAEGGLRAIVRLPEPPNTAPSRRSV